MGERKGKEENTKTPKNEGCSVAEVGATGLAEIGVVGITMSAAILGFSGISVVKEMNI